MQHGYEPVRERPVSGDTVAYSYASFAPILRAMTSTDRPDFEKLGGNRGPLLGTVMRRVMEAAGMVPLIPRATIGFLHFGILDEAGRVTSKFGQGPVLNHPLGAVQADWGNAVYFFRKVTSPSPPVGPIRPQ